MRKISRLLGIKFLPRSLILISIPNILIGISLSSLSIWFISEANESTTIKNHDVSADTVFWAESLPWVFFTIGILSICVSIYATYTSRRYNKNALFYTTICVCIVLVLLIITLCVLMCVGSPLMNNYYYTVSENTDQRLSTNVNAQKKILCCFCEDTKLISQFCCYSDVCDQDNEVKNRCMCDNILVEFQTSRVILCQCILSAFLIIGTTILFLLTLKLYMEIKRTPIVSGSCLTILSDVYVY